MHSLLPTAFQSAKKTIPGGCRQQYIPTWEDECNNHYKEFVRAEDKQSADAKAADLMDHLKKNRNKQWEETIKEIDFTHSSRKAWKTFNRLSGHKSDPKQCPIAANSIAKQLLANRPFIGVDKQHDLSVKRQCSMMWGVPGLGGHLTTPFTTLELIATIKLLKDGKAQGPDNIPSEFMMHFGKKCLEWVRKFYFSCFEHTVISKIWRRATVVAILKPNKPAGDPKSYRPISLLCVSYKILEKLILARINPVIESQLPMKQAGFRQGRSTAQQILKLTCEIEKSFENGYKAGAVMVDLTAAYDTVWHQGLALKLLRTIPDRHLVHFIMNILSNRSFKLKTSTGQISRLRILKNGLLQGSTLSPILFNIYISDIPTTFSRQYSYADNNAFLNSHKCWPKVEETLSRDMENLADYLQTWTLKLNTTKTTSTPFHLNNHKAQRQLNI